MYSRKTIRVVRTCGGIATLLLALAAACSDHDPGAERTETLGVVSPNDTITLLAWNVENFYDLTDNGTEYPEYKPDACGWDRFTFEVKLTNTASVLAAADADIAVLCEIENDNVVEQLRGELRRRGVSYRFYASGDKPNRTTNRPVVLSKYPIVYKRGIGTVMVDGYWSRNILEVAIALGPDTLIVFANHWPSKRHPESHRVETARLLAQRLAELPPHTDYVVAGDLNADYGECETFLTAGLDNTRGMTGINHILKTVDSPPNTFVDYVYEHQLAQCAARCHYDTWLELPETDRGCRVHRGQWSTPDHILLPPSLYDSSGISYVDNSFAVFTMGDSLLRKGEPYRWVIAYRGAERFHIGRGYSDHLPITARFTSAPFRCADSIVPRPPVRSGRMTFENGMEGWLGTRPGITLRRELAGEPRGYTLHVSGTNGNANGTVARVCLTRWRYTRRTPSRLVCHLRGRARMCLRVRELGARRWTYYAPPGFAASGRASYDSLNQDDWALISLQLPSIRRSSRALELEVRVLKRTGVSLWLDDVVVE
ncbi:MAG: hypothetical protein GF331_06395 [Chitinivibrionales bacterium]|nr:hypothetical protein [Chitinivibrionales bacterium]